MAGAKSLRLCWRFVRLFEKEIRLEGLSWVAYNELHGDTHHWVKWYRGYHSFKKNGRTLVVASALSTDPTIDTAAAENELWAVPTQYYKTVFGGSKHLADLRAEDIYHVYNKYFPKDFKESCIYASAGVIEKDADIAHKASPNRLAIKVKTKFSLHVFG